MEIKNNNEEIITALGIEKCSPELQAQIIGKFGEILFKRLLLLLPETIGKEVIEKMCTLPLEQGMGELIATLDVHVPEALLLRKKILATTLTEFQLMK